MVKSKFIYYSLLFLLPILTTIIIVDYEKAIGFSIIWTILIFVSLILSVLSYIFYNKRKQIYSRLFFVISIIIFIVSIVVFVLNKYDMLSVFSSVATFKEFILSTKSKGLYMY